MPSARRLAAPEYVPDQSPEYGACHDKQRNLATQHHHCSRSQQPSCQRPNSHGVDRVVELVSLTKLRCLAGLHPRIVTCSGHGNQCRRDSRHGRLHCWSCSRVLGPTAGIRGAIKRRHISLWGATQPFALSSTRSTTSSRLNLRSFGQCFPPRQPGPDRSCTNICRVGSGVPRSTRTSAATLVSGCAIFPSRSARPRPMSGCAASERRWTLWTYQRRFVRSWARSSVRWRTT